MKMLCPYHLENVDFVENKPSAYEVLYTCPMDKSIVPNLYVSDYRAYPPVVVNVIGFRMHGKTVYLSSLFLTIDEIASRDNWPKFISKPLDDNSLKVVYDNIEQLKVKGELPAATQKIFPKPSLFHIKGIPGLPNCCLLIYDTGGEVFERPADIVEYAHFMRRAKTAMIIFSITDLKNPSDELSKLLETYLIGLSKMNVNPRKFQHLLVVYSKGDMLGDHFTNWKDLDFHLNQNPVVTERKIVNDPREYYRQIKRISSRLEQFTRRELEAAKFVKTARDNFRSVDYLVVSSLGNEPKGRNLSAKILPKCVIDPIYMAIKNQFSWKRNLSFLINMTSSLF